MSATRTVPLYYDFWGFPRHYYEVTYPAPGAPHLAESVRGLLGAQVHELPLIWKELIDSGFESGHA